MRLSGLHALWSWSRKERRKARGNGSRGEEAAQILLRRTHTKRAGFHVGDNEIELTGGGWDILFST